MEKQILENCAIGAKIAAGLSVLYLPALPPPVVVTIGSPRRPHSKVTTPRQVPRQPQRSPSGEQTDLATSCWKRPDPLSMRGDDELRKVIEDQVSPQCVGFASKS